MLNVPELREKFHAARMKDSSTADVARSLVPKMLDELQSLQSALAGAEMAAQDLHAVIAAQETERREVHGRDGTTDAIDEFVLELSATLDEKSRVEFSDIERWSLKASMIACRMEEYPHVTGPIEGKRYSGLCICEKCGNEYFQHPMDWRLIGYGDRPFLHIICDGRLVKL